jgi:diguanylate cyclase (GGDEF)-like protein
VLALAVAFELAHTALGVGRPALSALVKDGLYTAIELTAVALCAARVVSRREDRAAWVLITAGLLAWTGGDLLWTVWLNFLSSPPAPSAADALYLLWYPAIYVALGLMIRSHFRHAGASAWLDGMVVGLATASVVAAFIFPAVLASSTGSSAAVAVDLAYPLGDFLLLVFISIGITLSGWRPGRQWLLLGLGLGVAAGADMVYLYQQAKGTYVVDHVLDAAWPAAMALIAIAAWQPSQGSARRSSHGDYTVLLPAGFGALALGILVYGTLHRMSNLAIGLATAAMVAAGLRAALTYRENLRMLRRESQDAATDALTGLRNRRRLMDDLDLAVERGMDGEDHTLAFFDLNGFKRYNDTFGHGAGDALLRRLGGALGVAVQGRGEAYRLGGDEFCVLLEGRFSITDGLVSRSQEALTECGSGFTITASCGVVIVPEDAATVTSALALADKRMYTDKGSSGRSSHTQIQSVLMRLLGEREPTLQSHLREVGELTAAIGRRFELDSEQLDELRRAAELHDLGKLAIPEGILRKAGPLSEGEMGFLRQHTIIGERILDVAPALRPVARLVRSSHERWDGSGYPDALEGVAIPLGSRIIAACDAYTAMLSDRPYGPARTPSAALAELRRHAGRQFDPQVVEAIWAHMAAGKRQSAPAGSGDTLTGAAGPSA